jgi:hypothetical protein
MVPAVFYNYTALGAFNALSPKYANAHLIAEGIPYEQDERQELDIDAAWGATEPLTILLLVFEVSWEDGFCGGYEFVGRAFAARGYFILAMGYRLLPENRFPTFVEGHGRCHFVT